MLLDAVHNVFIIIIPHMHRGIGKEAAEKQVALFLSFKMGNEINKHNFLFSL